MQPTPPPPVYVRRNKKRKHLPFGGAWKVAMADFALAMMALFLVLWIVNSSNQAEREAISEYFKNPRKSADAAPINSRYVVDLQGTPPMSDNASVEASIDPEKLLKASDIQTEADKIERQKLQKIQQQLIKRISQSPTLSPFKNQILLDLTTEGLRIQIVDQTNRPMFDSASANLRYYSEDILWELAPLLKNLDYKLSLTGHTDSLKLKSDDTYVNDGNWLLSAARADSARRALMEAGINKSRIAQVMGMGDSAPLDENNPQAAINRRISITLLNRRSAQNVDSRTGQNKGLPTQAQPLSPSQQQEQQQSTQRINQLQQQRERADNSYDNPPNLFENP